MSPHAATLDRPARTSGCYLDGGVYFATDGGGRVLARYLVTPEQPCDTAVTLRPKIRCSIYCGSISLNW